MNLDLENSIFKNLKENKFVQDFMNELSNYLKNQNVDEKIPILEKIALENGLTTGNSNSIIWKENEVILEYAEKNFSDNSMYFVKDSKKTYWLNNQKHYNDNVYSVLKVENNEIEEIEIKKENMPQNIGVNDVFTMKDGNYVINNIATKELQEEISNMAKEVIDKQNINLYRYRKEGHLYVVTEEIGNNRFLLDATEKSESEFEEVNLPRDLLDKATQGVVLKYENGKYEYYSNDGFEIMDKLYS